MNTLFGYTQTELIRLNALHTAQEINHQPILWQHLLAQLTNSDTDWVKFLTPILNHPEVQIILTGAGSSAFAGKTLAPWLKSNTNRDVLAIATTDIVANPTYYLTPNKPTLLVSFGRSGNSPESVAAVKLADQISHSIHHLMLVCNPTGELATYAAQKENALALIMPEGSNDQSFAMTSSFSCMMLAATLLLNDSILDNGIVNNDAANTVNHHLLALKKSISHIDNILLSHIKTIAQSNFKRYVVIGSCGMTGLAEEAALKMLELTAGQIATRHDSALGLRHGPKFMIDKETLLLQFISNDLYTQKYDLDLMSELKNNGIAANHIVLTAGSQAKQATIDKLEAVTINQSTLLHFNLLDLKDDFYPLFTFLYFTQLLAMETSIALNNTPDNPCPTGEVNRVVQGVIIHDYP